MIFKNKKHPKCKGFWTPDYGNGSDFDCGYKTIIDCENCKYGVGKKNPEAKCNLLTQNQKPMSKAKELFKQEREKISLNEINKNTRELLYMCSMNFKGIFEQVQTICNQPKTKKQNHNEKIA